MRKLILISLLILSVYFTSASEWYECITDDDCSGYGSEYICVDHVCVNSLCTKNSDCLNTEFCNKSQQCQPKLNDGSNCDNITYEGTRSADDEACLSGYCDNDGKGNSDDYWCYTPEDNYLDNQDNMCEYDINSMFDFTCDELNRTKDCSIANGRGYWCNESCMAENKDVSREACTARGINCHFDDFVWALSGEPSAAYVENQWEYKDTHTFECCGDDLNESFVNSSFYQGHNSNDTRCCLSKDACVVNGICQLGYKEGGHETSCYDGIDDNCNNKTDFCDGRYDIGCSEYDGLDDDCKAVIYGHVKDNYGFTVSNATVTALTVFHYNAFEETISFKTRTDSNGRYNLTVYGNSSYDIVATKFGYHTASNSRHLNLADNWNLNITMQRETECNPDCTKVYSNLCYPECEGLNGCHFYNQKTMQLCNAKAKYVIMDYNSSHAVECCSGKPYVKLPSSEPKVEVDNATIVVRITKPIMYRGKLIKMVIAVANK